MAFAYNTVKRSDFMVVEAGLGIAVFGIASLLWSNKKISVKRYTVSGKNNLKILHLSDLHMKKFGRGYEKLLKKIPHEKYDFICITGDLISRHESEFDEKILFLKSLKEIALVYFVTGNHEAEGTKNYEKIKAELIKIGVTILDNSSESFEKDGENTVIAGFSSEKRFFRNDKNGFSGLYKINTDYLTEKLGEKTEEFTILLAHSPFFFQQYGEWGADLTLCGHVHGGVVRIPFYRGILSPERKFFPKYDGGLFEKQGKKMIVSRGIGKLRLFNPTEIVVIDIKKG